MRPRDAYKSTYECWVNMRTRCNNPNYRDFRNYGGRGIGVCDRWATFDAFLADMGPQPKGLTIERRDNDKGYDKENCYWATRLEQARNRASNVIATVDGVTLHALDWAAMLGVSRNAFYTKARRYGCEEAVRHYQTHGVRRVSGKNC